MWTRLCAALISVFLGGAASAEVTVFAAASLKNALDAVTTQLGLDARISYAGSSALARQITAGAPADVFFSANRDWMDLLEEQGALVPDTRRDVLSNRLVLISGTPLPLADVTNFDIASQLKGGFLAMGLTNAVPVGMYGKAALIQLGQWEGLQDRIAQTDNARSAMALVATGAAPLGIVYATDALADPRVHVAGLFPETSHPPIAYPVAALRDTPEIRAFLAALSSPEARSIFATNGFGVTQ